MKSELYIANNHAFVH